MMECESKRVVVSPEFVRKGSPPPFLMKTYMMVEDPATDAVISWNTDGTAFVVWQPAEFSRDLLPTLFKHCNFSSFVRQLNTYGFNKIATNRWEFSNSEFRKGERDQLREIRRRMASSNNKPQRNVQLQLTPPPPPPLGDQLSDDDQDQMSLSTSSSSELRTLADENKRLRRENSALNSELAAVKKKCEELLDLVAVYSEKGVEDNSNEGTKLFGVEIGR